MMPEVQKGLKFGLYCMTFSDNQRNEFDVILSYIV
jgi:hypothetical protein